MHEAKTLITGLHFPEGPRWHDGELYFSDFYHHAVFAITPEGERRTIVQVPEQPSGLGWLPDGRLLIVSMLDRRLLRLEPDGQLIEHADLAPLSAGACNDMVVDASGRAYVGHFGFDLFNNASFAPASLISIEPDGTLREAAPEMMFPNGTVITPDGKTMIVGESFARRLTAFDIGSDGALGNRRVWAELGDHVPDGICLDRDGAVWSADPRGNCVIRVAAGGEILDTVSTGSLGAFACMLGGTDGRTLFICASSTSGPDAAKQTDGVIATATVEVPGAGRP